jgi:hypothetical protein
MSSNAPYSDQRKFNANANVNNIVGISNSPFTDQRKEQGGGGPSGDGTGNVQYETSNQTLNIRVGEVNTLITAIDQGANEFVIGNDRGTLDFTQAGDVILSHGFQDSGNLVIKAEATSTGNGNILIETETSNILGAGDINLTSKNSVRLTSDESTVINAQALSSSTLQGTFISSLNQDVEILAKEFTFVRGEKGVLMESGLLNGVYENSIDMEIDQQNSKIVIKSEGDSFENRILLQTVSNGVNAGGCNLVLVSDDIPANSDKILINVQSILQNQEWLNIKGTDTNNDEHSLVITRDEVKWSAFEFFNFAGQDQLGVVPKNPVFQFSNIQTNKEEYYQFKSFPTSPGQILEISAGLGEQAIPWELNWVAQSSGGGDVTYDDLSNEFSNNAIPVTRISYGGENYITARNLVGSSQILELRSEGTNQSHAISLLCNRTGSEASSIVLTDPSAGSGATYTCRIGNPSTNVGGWYEIGGAVNSTTALRSGMRFVGAQSQNNRGCSFEKLDYVTFVGRDSLETDQGVTNLVFNRFTGFTRVNELCHFRYVNTPDPTNYNETYVLKCTPQPGGGGQPNAGSRANPLQLEWVVESGGAGSLNNLEINYDTTTSTLILSDPVDGLPAISTTSIVPGRTVLIEDVVVNGTTELSALGLSNSIFPPPLQGQTGYFAGLIGNSPPRVSLNPTTGLTNWFAGASFKITLAGKITKIGGYDDIRLKVYSNRGQPSENILNSFSMITRSVQPPPSVGWNWVIDFTCRKVNDGGILGVISTSSAFNYTDDTYVLENLGAIVSNTNSSFDTSVEQFLDCTIEFDYYNNSNNISTTLCTIERIF